MEGLASLPCRVWYLASNCMLQLMLAWRVSCLRNECTMTIPDDQLASAPFSRPVETRKHVADITLVLQSNERERARRDFVDATRMKVLSAAQRHVTDKKKAHATSAGNGHTGATKHVHHAEDTITGITEKVGPFAFWFGLN